MPRSIARLAFPIFALMLAACGQRPVDAVVGSIEPEPASLHLVGAFDPATRRLVAREGEAGYLHYGPYLPLEPQALTAEFDLDAEGPDGELLGTVDVSAATESVPETVLATAPLLAGRGQRIGLEFVAVAGARHEFRVRSEGRGRIELSKITIVRR